MRVNKPGSNMELNIRMIPVVVLTIVIYLILL